MSMWRKTLVYLGLVEEPEEYDELPERIVEPRFSRPTESTLGSDVRVAEAPTETEAGNVRRLQRVADPGAAHVRPMASGMGSRVQVVAVSTFDEGAAEIGRQYRMGSPVLFDMADADGATARRVLDFVSGVTFALRGRMTRTGGRAFLIVPEGVELPASERERLASLGYASDD